MFCKDLSTVIIVFSNDTETVGELLAQYQLNLGKGKASHELTCSF